MNAATNTDRVQRVLYGRQRGVRQRTHGAANGMVDLAVRMFCQAKEGGGSVILLLRGGETGGYPAPLHSINGDPRRAGAIGYALRQSLTGLVDGAFAQIDVRQPSVDLCQVQGIF